MCHFILVEHVVCKYVVKIHIIIIIAILSFVEPKQANDSDDRSDSDHDMARESEDSGDSEEFHQVWEFCKSRSKSVEVLYENMTGHKILTRIHFPFDPHVIIHLM